MISILAMFCLAQKIAKIEGLLHTLKRDKLLITVLKSEIVDLLIHYILNRGDGTGGCQLSKEAPQVFLPSGAPAKLEPRELSSQLKNFSENHLALLKNYFHPKKMHKRPR
jgi:hypothetical protein